MQRQKLEHELRVLLHTPYFLLPTDRKVISIKWTDIDLTTPISARFSEGGSKRSPWMRASLARTGTGPFPGEGASTVIGGDREAEP